MYLIPPESKAGSNVSELDPNKKIRMTQFSFQTTSIKDRFIIVIKFLNAANQMFWHGKLEIVIENDSIPIIKA